MRALSIRQPWAFAVVVGAKTVENRTWSSTYVGPLAIHASRREEREAVPEVLRMVHGQLRPPFDMERLRRLYEENKRLGCVVGQVEMTGCTKGGDAGTWDEAMVRWFKGPFGFVFENARIATQPIPFRGRLGLWELPAGAIAGKLIEGPRLLEELASGCEQRLLSRGRYRS